MIQTAILAGCYPGVGVAKDGSKMRKIRTWYNILSIFTHKFKFSAQNNASFHPSSVLRRQLLDPSKRSEQVNRFSNNIEPKIEFLAYQELIKLEEGITVTNFIFFYKPCIILAPYGNGLYTISSFDTSWHTSYVKKCD